MSLLFLFVAQEPRYWRFLPLTIARTLHQNLQKKKWSYVGSWALNQKTKDTFYSSTFKVSESRVSLVFLLLVQEPRYWQFFPLTIALTSYPELQTKKWSYLGPIKKLRTLYFVQLLKFEKAKCPYFFDSWPRSRDIDNFFL